MVHDIGAFVSSRPLLSATVAPPLARAAAPAFQRGGKRPNIMSVITDDLRYDGIGCNGPFARMPNIDRVAGEGVRFTNFFTAVPLCSLSRASFLTRLYPHSHRSVSNDKHGMAEISHTLVTFPRMLCEDLRETRNLMPGGSQRPAAAGTERRTRAPATANVRAKCFISSDTARRNGRWGAQPLFCLAQGYAGTPLYAAAIAPRSPVARSGAGSAVLSPRNPLYD